MDRLTKFNACIAASRAVKDDSFAWSMYLIIFSYAFVAFSAPSAAACVSVINL